mgnify:FL=1
MATLVKRNSIIVFQTVTHQWTFKMETSLIKHGNVKHVKEVIDGMTLKGIVSQEECLKKRTV